MKENFFSLFDSAIDLINNAIYTIVALAVLGFMWGIVKIIFNSDNEVAKKEGRSFMMYGLLTLFVMTSMWGLVNLLNGTIKIGEKTYKGDVNSGSNRNNSPGIDSIQDKQDLFENNREQRRI